MSLSSTAQTVLTAAETVLEDTETYSEIVAAAEQGNPVAQALLAAEAAIAAQS